MPSPLPQCHAWLGVTQSQCSSPNSTHTVYIDLDGGRQTGREGPGKERGRMEGGRDGARGGWEGIRGRMEGSRGGREEVMMLGRERSSVEEGRVEGGWVDERNERGRDGTRNGVRGKERREEASRGEIEGGREGPRKGSKGGKETSREVSRGGHWPRRALASVQYIHKPSHNAAIGLETLVLQMRNSEQV